LLQLKYKLLDTFFKSLYSLIIVYVFPIEISGFFGFFIVIVGLGSVIIGFERYISFQIETVDISSKAIQQKLSDLFAFYLFNLIFAAPIFSIIVYFKIFQNPLMLLLCILILFSEMLSNNIYNIGVVHVKYIIGMRVVIIKNLLLVLFSIQLYFINLDNPLFYIFLFWSILSTSQIFIFIYYFLKFQNLYNIKSSISFSRILDQYKISKFHFLLGLVALVWIQADRLLVSIWFDTKMMGIYYRHVAITSIFHQIFFMASFNRLIPQIYSSAKKNGYNILSKIIIKEYKIILSIVLFIILSILISYYTFLKEYFLDLYLQLNIILSLIFILTIRIYADFQSMILNAYKLESETFKYQALCLIIFILLMMFLVPIYKIKGVVFSLFVSTLVYTFIITKFNKSYNFKINS
tara:strand:- start:17131 stop:18351 length:1221 start_codon:yes stop_codon:yes gene_type:complete